MEQPPREFDDPPRYNIAPSQRIVAVTQPESGQPRALERFRWGLVPFWADDAQIGNRMINARGESVDSKPAFRAAFRKRRCLVPADGYYEWKTVKNGKQPYLIERHDGGMLAIAGLWEENHKASESGEVLRTCTLVTTDANPSTRQIHDRMPVMVLPEDHDRWLDPAVRDRDALRSLLRPAPDELLRATAVSRHVNSPTHDDPSCVEPVEVDEG